MRFLFNRDPTGVALTVPGEDTACGYGSSGTYC